MGLGSFKTPTAFSSIYDEIAKKEKEAKANGTYVAPAPAAPVIPKMTNVNDPFAQTVNLPTPTPGYNPSSAVTNGRIQLPPTPAGTLQISPANSPTAVPVTGSIDSAPGSIPGDAGQYDPMKAITTGMGVGAEKYGQTGLDAASFKPAFAQMLALYQDRLGGYNSQQLAAQRSEQSQMINSQMLAAQRQNRAGMAAQGVRGAAALAGNQNLADQAVNARGQMENALLAKQFEAQGGALANYNQFVGGERGVKLGSEFGYGNLYQTVAGQAETNRLIADYIKGLPGGAGGGGSGSGGSGGVAGLKPEDFREILQFNTRPAQVIENQIPQYGQYSGYVTQPTNTVMNNIPGYGLRY